MSFPPSLTLVLAPGTAGGVDLSARVSDLKYTNAAPGGFGNLTGRIRMRNPTEVITHLQPIVLTDPTTRVLFEGRVEDIRPFSRADDSGFEFEAFGYQRQFEFTPFQKLFITRSIPWDPLPLARDPAGTHPEKVVLTVGNWDQSDPAKTGVGLECSSGTVVTAGQYFGAVFWPASNYNLRRIKFTIDTVTNGTAIFFWEVYSLNAAGTYTSQSSNNGALTGSAQTVALPADTQGVALLFRCTTGGTASANLFARFYELRLIGDNRATQDEPVYGHSVLRDAAEAAGLKMATWYGDTSFALPSAFWPDSVSASQAITEISAFYNRYWAVWEDQTLHWPTNDFTTIEWSVRRREAKEIQIDRSVAESASAARIRWAGADGRNFEQTITDPRADNVWKLAEATKIDIVDLGRSASSAAAQVGAVYFPDRSYPLVRGTVTLSADARVGTDGSQAYTMRAGETIQLPDAFSTLGPLSGQGYDRQTIFQIKNVEVDWEEQTVTVQLDNQRDLLTQVLARTAAALEAFV